MRILVLAGEYKCLLLRAAIQRGNAGWRLVLNVAATSFWGNYWELANAFSSAKPAVWEALITALELLAWYNHNELHARGAN